MVIIEREATISKGGYRIWTTSQLRDAVSEHFTPSYDHHVLYSMYVVCRHETRQKAKDKAIVLLAAYAALSTEEILTLWDNAQ